MIDFRKAPCRLAYGRKTLSTPLQGRAQTLILEAPLAPVAAAVATLVPLHEQLHLRVHPARPLAPVLALQLALLIQTQAHLILLMDHHNLDLQGAPFHEDLVAELLADLAVLFQTDREVLDHIDLEVVVRADLEAVVPIDRVAQVLIGLVLLISLKAQHPTDQALLHLRDREAEPLGNQGVQLLTVLAVGPDTQAALLALITLDHVVDLVVGLPKGVGVEVAAAVVAGAQPKVVMQAAAGVEVEVEAGVGVEVGVEVEAVVGVEAEAEAKVGVGVGAEARVEAGAGVKVAVEVDPQRSQVVRALVVNRMQAVMW